METFLIAVDALGLTIGSLAAAALLCWICCWLFELLGYANWGPLYVAITGVVGVVTGLSHSLFVHMTLLFLVVMAGLFWIVNSWRPLSDPAGRPDHREPGGFSAPSSERLDSRRGRYPTITSCIAEDRQPLREEIKLVAARMLREDVVGSGSDPSFGARRSSLRAARIALGQDDLNDQ